MAWLYQVDLPVEKAIPFCEHFLDDPNTRIRVDAIRFLEKIGPPASDIAPKLVKLLDDSKLVVRRYAERALKAIKPESAEQWKAD